MLSYLGPSRQATSESKIATGAALNTSTYHRTMRRFLIAVLLLPASLLTASRSDYLSIKQKFRLIQRERLKPGTRVALSAGELNAYVAAELPKVAPAGIRAPSVELPGNNVAIGHATVNLAKLKAAQGDPPGWIMENLLDGDHELTVTAAVDSSDGFATVDLKRVEIDGLAIQGPALKFLIDNYLMPRYPDAKIGRPFQLDHRMERLELKPGVAYVVVR